MLSRGRAVFLVLFGATFMSFTGLFVRFIEDADAFQILVYRTFGLAIIVMIFACFRRRISPLTFLSQLDRWSVLIGLFLGTSLCFYIYSILNTNIASALFLLSSAPLFAAFLSWVILGERPTKVTWGALGLAITGVTIMVADGFDTGGALGNFFALVAAGSFACMLITIRAINREEPLGGTFLGGIFACAFNACLIAGMGSTFVIGPQDMAISLLTGVVFIGLGFVCITLAATSLLPSEVSILILLESILGPIWVWIIFGETATVNVLIGGAVVLAAVILQTVGGGGDSDVPPAPVGTHPS